MTEHLPPRSEPQAAPGNETPPYTLINLIAGSEQKLLLAATLGCADPDEFYRECALQTMLVDKQGDSVAWNPTRGVVECYFISSLLPAGVAEKSSVKGRRHATVDAYRSTPYGRTGALALTGAVLNWSLEHPECSVQKVIGSSRHRKTHSNSYIKTPQSRFMLYERLTEQDEPVHIRDFSEEHEISRLQCDGLLTTLCTEDILSRRKKGFVEFASQSIEEAIGALVRCVVDSQADKRQAHYIALAQGLTEDPKSFTAIAKKASRYSINAATNTRWTPTVVQDAIYDALSDGPATVTQIVSYMRDKGLQYSAQVVRKRLREMLDEREVRTETDPTRRSRQLYSPTPFDELR